MNYTNSNSLRRKLSWANAEVIGVLCFLVVALLSTNASGADTLISRIKAEFAGAPLNGTIPRGEAKFEVFSDGNKKFEASVANVNLPNGTILDVFVDQVRIGSLIVNNMTGELERETRDGQSVPEINSRSRVVIANTAGLTIVAGSFSNLPGPGPTPSPTASPSPNPNGETRLESRLAGASIGGLAPKGHAKFEVRANGRRKLNVEVEKVNLPAGTVLNVFIDNNKIGEITVSQMLETELELDTEHGLPVPPVTTLSTVVITNAQGATILSGTFNTTSSAISGNDIDDTNYFVEQHYRDFLDREADDSGLDFWRRQITACGDDSDCKERARINTSGAFFLSIEFQETGFLLYRFNKLAFGSMPRRNPFLIEMQVTAAGVVVGRTGWENQLAENKRQAAERWSQRDDFQARFGSLSNRDYIEALYRNAGISGRENEKEDLSRRLDAGLETRGSALRRVAEDGEFSRRESNPAFVLMQYFGYLHRNPDEGPDHDLSGFNFWLTKLNQHHGDFHEAEMVKAFLRSGEYRDRFNW